MPRRSETLMGQTPGRTPSFALRFTLMGDLLVCTNSELLSMSVRQTCDIMVNQSVADAIGLERVHQGIPLDGGMLEVAFGP
jgi:hypothetical protein